MNRSRVRWLVALLCAAFGLWLPWNAGLTDELHWRWAAFRDDAPGYERYLESFPRGAHVNEASKRHDDRRWAAARSSDAPEALETYLRLPGIRHAAEASARLEELRWRTAIREHTITSYRRYLERHPGGPFASEATARLEALRRDDRPYEETLSRGSREALEAFVVRFPGHRREADIREALRDIEGRDVFDLLKQKKLEARTAGSGIQSVSLELRRRVNHHVKVRIPVGTFFVSRNASSQNMVATDEETVMLTGDGWVSVNVSAACANRPRDIPDDDDSFAIKSTSGQRELERLMPALRAAAADFRTRQAAVWIVTDDADYDDLGILVQSVRGAMPARDIDTGRHVGYTAFGSTRVIDEQAATAAMRICDRAGIDIRRKAIWRDRNLILRNLNDAELKKWLQGMSGR